MSDFFSAPSAGPSALRERLVQRVDEGRPIFKRLAVILALVLVGGGWAFNNLRSSGSSAEPSQTVSALPRAGQDSEAPTSNGDDPAAASSADSSAETGDSKDPSGGNGAGATEEDGSKLVVVQVTGAVVSPGVYTLNSSSRVDDAVAKAGGPTEEADLERVNLAAKIQDGQRILVVRKGQAAPASAPSSGGAAGAAGADAAPAGPVDLNTATAEQLDALPGVGPSTAQAILDYREQVGSFKSVDELNEVKGIGDAKFADLKARVTV